MATRKKLAEIITKSIEDESDVPSDAVKDETLFVDAEQERAIRNEYLIRLKRENESLAQDMIERKRYAHKIFVLTIIWSALIFLILFLCGWHGLFLSDKVIITLITSTTINFFGFFFLVTKYLFNAGINKTKASTKNKPRRKK